MRLMELVIIPRAWSSPWQHPKRSGLIDPFSAQSDTNCLTLLESFPPCPELELELIQSHMAQKPMLRGEVGARVRVIRACGQRRERRYGWARWCKAPG